MSFLLKRFSTHFVWNKREFPLSNLSCVMDFGNFKNILLKFQAELDLEQVPYIIWTGRKTGSLFLLYSPNKKQKIPKVNRLWWSWEPDPSKSLFILKQQWPFVHCVLSLYIVCVYLLCFFKKNKKSGSKIRFLGFLGRTNGNET